jgi:hypothetical protein
VIRRLEDLQEGLTIPNEAADMMTTQCQDGVSSTGCVYVRVMIESIDALKVIGSVVLLL